MLSFCNKTLLGLCFLVFFACKSKKEIISTENCNTIATVKDFTGLDGCGLMIVLENGDKLLPGKIDNNFTLRAGQRVKMDYTEMKDQVSVCMAEKAIINITCIELVAGKPIVPECYDASDWYSVPWMKEVTNNIKPMEIRKYNFRTDGWAYNFILKTKQVLYDCQGTLLCEHSGTSPNKCKEKYLPGQTGKLIYKKPDTPQD